MDQAGIDVSVLSVTTPGVQAERDTAVAIRRAREVNDFLAEEVRKRPTRYAGFAHLPLQDPAVAADELERCVRELGFVGSLINGHTNGIYLDDRRFDPFWERVQDLGVPIYLHPANMYDMPRMFEGHPELLGATWSWTVETATHALRLVFGGTFERFPGARLILGHMGETIPYVLWRLDNCARRLAPISGQELSFVPSEIMRRNIAITTTGVCSADSLQCALAALGVENVMFSVDYPYESSQVVAEFIESAPLSEAVRAQVCHQNAERLLRLK
jgi:2,3-dihydroxybenzoate decarboxylase